MIVNGIEIKKGYLVKITNMPIDSNYEERESFHEVCHIDSSSRIINHDRIAICLPQRLIDIGCGGIFGWGYPDKTYWWSAKKYIKEIKGYFSNDS